jgi:hypothetical protein
MAFTILNKKQIPLQTIFTDGDANGLPQVFTVPPQVALIPTLDAHIPSKRYVDDQLAAAISSSSTGLDVKQSVRLATTVSVGTYNATGGAKSRGQLTAVTNSVDGFAVLAGNRILVKDHTNPAANGIYVVTTVGTGATGVWDRATDFDDDAEVTANAFTFVEEGAARADTAWVVTTNDAIIVGGASGTAIVWMQFASSVTVTLENITGNLSVAKGGTGATIFTVGGLLRGNGTNAVSIAGPADVVNALGSTPVNNAIAAATAVNSTNTANIAVTNDNAPTTSVFVSWVSGSSGNQATRVTSAALTFIPSTGVLSATGFSGGGSALTSLTAANLLGTIPAAVLQNSTIFIGTTGIALNRASGNLGLAGISSIAYTGSTSGSAILIAPAVATGTFVLPTVAGNLVGTGDSATVTNTMLFGAIADSKLLQITATDKVSAGALTGTLFTFGSTPIAAKGTVTSVTGLVNLTGTGSIDFSKFLGLATDTVTSPSFSWTGDLTTGLYRPTASQIAVAIAGVQRGLFTSSGLTVVGTLAATTLSGALSNAVTFNNSGSGVGSGTTYDASAARVVSWNTIGAQAAVTSTNYVTKQIIVFSGSANYTMANVPVLGTEMVFLNGVLQHPLAGNDYTILGAAITFTFVPTAADVVSVTYFR